MMFWKKSCRDEGRWGLVNEKLNSIMNTLHALELRAACFSRPFPPPSYSPSIDSMKERIKMLEREVEALKISVDWGKTRAKK